MIVFEATLSEINNPYKAGRFSRWELCKFPAWEVALIHEICKQKGWIRPAVFQGIYYPLLRSVETELLPCIRHYEMSFEVAQPLASGLLTSRYRRDMPDEEHEPGRRFGCCRCDGSRQGQCQNKTIPISYVVRGTRTVRLRPRLQNIIFGIRRYEATKAVEARGNVKESCS